MLKQELKMYRARNGMSQKALADRLGVAQNSVSQWEMGQRMPSIKRLSKIADVLGCSIESIFSVSGTTEEE